MSGGEITKSAEPNDIFPLKWCNHKYFHKFKNFISQSGSEVTPNMALFEEMMQTYLYQC